MPNAYLLTCQCSATTYLRQRQTFKSALKFKACIVQCFHVDLRLGQNLNLALEPFVYSLCVKCKLLYYGF
jgi:hypothetical protein